MIVKVSYLSTYRNHKDFVKVQDGEFSLGDIVVVEDGQSTEQYGVITKVDFNGKCKLSKKKIKIANNLERIYFWLDFEKFILYNKVKLSSLSEAKYRESKGNKFLSQEDIVNKMTRNMLLVHKPKRINVGANECLIFFYGALRIIYSNGTVHNIHNKSDYPKRWQKDKDKYDYFSKILGVE